MRTGVAVLALAIAAVAGTARAQGVFDVVGVGGQTCAVWTAEQRTPASRQAVAQASWLGGYLTAYNNYQQPRGGNVVFPDFDGLEGLMNRYCRLHPDHTIAYALEVMIEVMKSQADESGGPRR